MMDIQYRLGLSTGILLIAGLGIFFLNSRPPGPARSSADITSYSHVPETSHSALENRGGTLSARSTELWQELEDLNHRQLPTPHDRRVLLSALLHRWIAVAPESALEALQAINDPSVASRLEIEVIRGLATRYPSQVMHWMQQVDFLSQRAVNLGIHTAISHVGGHDDIGSLLDALPSNGEAAAAQAWVDHAILQGGYLHAATTLENPMLPETIALSAKANLASDWFAADPESALPWLTRQLQHGVDPAPILKAALSAWQESDPTSAVEWLLVQEPKIASPNRIENVILAEAHATLRQGGTLEPIMDSITTLPEPAQQDALLAGLALAIDDLDPDTTRSLLMRIDNGNTRETIRAKLHIDPAH